MRTSTWPEARAARTRLDLPGRPEARDHLDLHGERREPLAEGLPVLEGQDGRRRQDRDLLSVEGGAHDGAHGDLGLAVADVAADESVHRGLGRHVGGDVGDGGGLVGGLLVLEGLLELALPGALGREGVAGPGLALGVEPQELRRHVAHRLLDPLLDLLPAPAAELVDDGARALGAGVFLDAVEGVDRDLELVASLVREDHELPAEPRHVEGLEPLEAPDAVVLVDDQVADAQVPEVGEEAADAATATTGVDVDLFGEDVAVGQDDEVGARELEAAGKGPDAHVDGGALSDGEVVFPQEVLESIRPSGVAEEENRPAPRAAEVGGEAPQVAGVAPDGPAGNVKAAGLGVDLPEVQGRRRLEALRQGLRGDERFLGLQGHRIRSLPALVARALLEVARLREDRLGIERDDGHAAEVVPRGDRGLGNERDELGQLVGEEAPVEPLEEGSDLAAVAEARGKLLSEIAQDRARGEEVGQGQDLEGFERALAPLGGGVEAAQALEGVAEELETHGAIRVGREDVEDAAAQGDLSGAGHGVLPPVASLVERLEEDLGRHLVPLSKRHDTGLEEALRQGRPQQTQRGRDEGAKPTATRGEQRLGAPERGIGVARQAPEGRRTRCRERKDVTVHAHFVGEGSEILRDLFEVALVRNDDEQRVRREKEREKKARGAGKAQELGAPLRASGDALRRRRRHRQGGDPVGGHVRRMRSRIAVVDRPGRRSTRTTRPPRLAHDFAPTMSSRAQSAPFTSTSGRRAG